MRKIKSPAWEQQWLSEWRRWPGNSGLERPLASRTAESCQLCKNCIKFCLRKAVMQEKRIELSWVPETGLGLWHCGSVLNLGRFSRIHEMQQTKQIPSNSTGTDIKTDLHFLSARLRYVLMENCERRLKPSCSQRVQ